MTTAQFNEKYKEYLEEGHYGLDIREEKVTKYLDSIFPELIKIEGFKYMQIKLKFGSTRFYTNLYALGFEKLNRIIEGGIESKINEIYESSINKNK